MANNPKTTEAAVVADLVARAVVAESAEKPIRRTHEAGTPFVILRMADGAEKVEQLASLEPPRKKVALVFCEAASFVDYFNEYKDADSRVFCDVEKRSFTGIIDYHGKATGDALGRRGEHRAVFTLKLTPGMEAWQKLAAQPVQQAALAEFLEDRYTDITEPEGAAVLELAKTLEVKNDVAIQSAQRRSDGGYDLNYQERVTTKAGQTGSFEVPSKMLLAIQVFQGGQIVDLPMRIRFRLSGGSVVFLLTFLGLEDLIRAEVDRVRANIDDAVERTVWAGSATVG